MRVILEEGVHGGTPWSNRRGILQKIVGKNSTPGGTPFFYYDVNNDMVHSLLYVLSFKSK